MLYGLAAQGNAPAGLKKLNKNGVPVQAILASSVVVALCIFINLFFPNKAFGILMSLVVSSLIINWLMISVTHLKFKKYLIGQGIKTLFPSFLYPISNYICLLFLVGILVIMCYIGKGLSVLLIPIWLLILFFSYKAINKIKK